MNGSDPAILEARESLNRYEKRTEHYGEQPEQGKEDHEAAMHCFDLEGLLAFGLSLYDYINRLDEAWRAKVFRNLVPHNPDTDRVIEELYRWWLKPCDRIMRRLAEFEKHFDVEGGQEFRAACREVQGILTPDEEFFAHERLARLRDEAIGANRRGDVEEMRSISD